MNKAIVGVVSAAVKEINYGGVFFPVQRRLIAIRFVFIVTLQVHKIHTTPHDKRWRSKKYFLLLFFCISLKMDSAVS